MTNPKSLPDAVEREKALVAKYATTDGDVLRWNRWAQSDIDDALHGLPALLSQLDKLETEKAGLAADGRRTEAVIAELSRQADESEAQRVAAQASNASLVGALRPFAAIYTERMRDLPDGSPRSTPNPAAPAWGYNGCNVDWGHFKTASEVISTLESGEATAEAKAASLLGEVERMKAKVEINDHNHAVMRDIYDKERDQLSARLAAWELAGHTHNIAAPEELDGAIATLGAANHGLSARLTAMEKAATVALGHLTGGMDGDWVGDPIALLRQALQTPDTARRGEEET